MNKLRKLLSFYNPWKEKLYVYLKEDGDRAVLKSQTKLENQHLRPSGSSFYGKYLEIEDVPSRKETVRERELLQVLRSRYLP